MRFTIVLLFFWLAAPGLAGTDMDALERALDGDLDAARSCLETSTESDSRRVIAANAFRAAGHDDRAIELLQDAMANGYRPALWTMVVHQVERQNWIEAYAWGRLAMLVDKHEADGAISDDEWPMRWTWQFTQRAARALLRSQFDRADALTEQVVARWYPALTAERSIEENASPRFTARGAPRYPSDEARARETGWTMLAFTFDAEGEVDRVLPVVETHRAFSEEAAKAVQGWTIDPGSVPAEDLDRLHVQLIEFQLEG